MALCAGSRTPVVELNQVFVAGFAPSLVAETSTFGRPYHEFALALSVLDQPLHCFFCSRRRRCLEALQMPVSDLDISSSFGNNSKISWQRESPSRCSRLAQGPIWCRFVRWTWQVSGPTYGSMMKAFGQAHDIHTATWQDLIISKFVGSDRRYLML